LSGSSLSWTLIQSRLLAIMLGRLEMSVDDCILRFVKIRDRATFSLDSKGSRLNVGIMEDQLKSIVADYTEDEDTLLLDQASETARCKT
jgi:hypothetical protein